MRLVTTHNSVVSQLALLISTCTLLFSALLHQAKAAKSDADDITLAIEEQCANFTKIDELSQRPQVLRRLQRLSIQPLTCRYSWIQKKNPLVSKLFLDERNGAIHTIDTIDREEYLACNSAPFCCSAATTICSITVSVGMQCGAHPMILLNVKLEISDKNDHVPRFPSANFTIEVPESAEVGSKFYFPAAVDLDSNPYSVSTYQLVPKGNRAIADLFELHASTSNRVQMTLRRKLDRETHDKYEFEVRAVDRGGQVGNMSLTVLVTDVNDHAPVFTAANKLYQVNVPEDFRVGDSILQVNATDNDAGENAAVTYEFHETASQVVREKFALEEDTGILTLRSPLDFESVSRFEFFVVAKNRAANPVRSDEASVLIAVQNVNDESPAIEVEYRNELVDDRTSGETPENLANTFVAFIFVSDRDDFGGVNCTLSNERFRLERFHRQPGSTDFRLNATRPFDRESNPLETVIITCTDRGQPPRSSSQLVKIQVKDVNDQPPTFMDSPIRCSVSENSHVGTPICQIAQHVRDLDDGENSLVKYTLDKNAQAFFRLEEFSGQLSAIGSFDRENRSSYQFLVFATDQGKPPLSATGTVLVTIDDVNDNVPQFVDAAPIRFSVREQRPREEYVGTVRAVDRDAEPDCRVLYVLESDRHPFRIAPSGEIFTTRELDRESDDSYELVVIATDSGSPAQSASTTVTIVVTGINDCHPTIVFPNAENNTVRISFMEPVQRQITAVQAFDRDASEPGLTYSIVSGNSHGLFAIDTNSGVLRVAKSLNDAFGQHNLIVRVDDGGSPNLHTEASFRIIVDNSVPAYDYQQSYLPASTQSNSDYPLNMMHVLVIAALACAIVFVLLAVSAILIRRRLIVQGSVFSSSSSARKSQNGRGRKEQRKSGSIVDQLLHSHSRQPPKKAAAACAKGTKRANDLSSQLHVNSSPRDYKVNSRFAQGDNQEDLEVQAAFSQLNPTELSGEMNPEDEMVYSAVDTMNGMYEDEPYAGEAECENNNKQALQTVAEHLCPHGRPGVLFAHSFETSPAPTSLVGPLDKLKLANEIETPTSDRQAFVNDELMPRQHGQANKTNVSIQQILAAGAFEDKDTRPNSHPHFNAVSFNQVSGSTASGIPMRQLFQDSNVPFCVYPPRPHTAMHAMQSNSFNSVAVSIATPDAGVCGPQACMWLPKGYFQYDECNNVTPIQSATVSKGERRGRHDRVDKYCTLEPQQSKVYGVVKGSFV